jgi:hypothetical protein
MSLEVAAKEGCSLQAAGLQPQEGRGPEAGAACLDLVGGDPGPRSWGEGAGRPPPLFLWGQGLGEGVEGHLPFTPIPWG